MKITKMSPRMDSKSGHSFLIGGATLPGTPGAGASGSTRSIRDEAEKEIARSPKISPDLTGQTPDELIHELRVHQIELETQAEELIKALLALEESRNKYLDLYEFAPIGYITLTDTALIADVNLTGATLLGVERSSLVRARFRKFIVPGDLDKWDQYFVSVREHSEKQTCTLTLTREDGSVFPARLESIRLTGSSDGTPTVRVAISDMTEIVQVEEEIKLKNVILSTQQETSLDGILAVDENGNILSFNRHFIELWDIPEDVIASGSHERVLQPVVDKLADPGEFVSRVTYLHDHKDEKHRDEVLLKDGRVLDRYSAPIVGQDRKYYGRVWYFRDITGRKEAEETLRETNEYLNKLIDFANAPIIVWDPDFRIIRFNHAFEHLTGRNEREVIGQPLDILFPKKTRDTSLALIKKTLTGERWETVEIPILASDGTIRTVLWNSANILTSEAELISTIAQGVDITERKQAEDEVGRSFERFKVVMDGLDALVYVVDMETFDLLFINKYGKDIWGEIEGQTCWKTIQSGQSGPCPFCTNDKLVDSNGNPTGVYHWEFQNTVTKKLYDCRDSAIRWLDGRLVRLEIATDITERKQAENMTALTTRKLVLMNDVTYQYIQNKVTAARGYTEISKDAKTETERLSFIEKEGHILADIHQLIKNTRQYQEIGILEPQWIPVEQSIRIAVSLVSPKQGISIETALNGLELYTDPLIEKIFANLIENAVIHGKTTTRIAFSCEETPEGLLLTCEDDGVGISPEVKARLFERSVGEKIHFGLFFVRECLALSGMMIRETGTPGKGARFEIVVPKGAYRFTGTGEK